MSQRTVVLPDIGEVLLVKRRGAKNLRLSIQPDGKIRVGLPYWAPYASAIQFAKMRSGWILQNVENNRPKILQTGHKIGKSHSLHLNQDPSAYRVSSRVKADLIVVKGHLHPTSLPMQTKAAAACERALKKESIKLLGDRIHQISAETSLSFKELKIKRMVSRWGSCSQTGTVTLSYFLVQLPWHLIDYVLVHELAHTKHLNHSPEFWELVEKTMPDAKRLKKEIKTYRPILLPA
jgi:predicted metal-dependent hydrolase